MSTVIDRCILLFVSLFLALVVNTDGAFFFDSSGTVRPKNPYGFIGETLNLTCNLTDRSISGNVSGGMYFKKQYEDGERVVPLRYVRILNTRSIRLEYPVQSGQDQGSYTCHLNRSEESLILGSQFVTVDYRPVKVGKVDCHVYNWEEMTCTWDLNQVYYNQDLLSVQLVWAILDGQWDCPHQNKTSCMWKSGDGKDSFQAGKMYYMSIIVITKDKNGKKVAESQSDVFTVDTMLIVKPAPVKHLQVLSKNSTCVSLSWTHKKKHRNMTCRLHVWQGDQVQEYNSIREMFKTVWNLHPAKDYVLQVSCIPVPHLRSEPEGNYSEWTSLVTRTLEDVPSGVPPLIPGSFRYDECPQTSECAITVYWKCITDDESNGEITHYKVQQTDTQSGETQEVVVNGTQRHVLLGIQKSGEYRVEVKARTRVGYSIKSAAILIQPMVYAVPFPEQFLVEAHADNLHVSWKPPVLRHNSPQGRWTGYTLFYCHGSKFTMKCLDEIEWVPLGSEDSSFMWKVAGGSLDNKMVGISSQMQIAGTVVSSGILWSLCTYKQNMKPSMVENVRFSAAQPDNGLMVQWDRADCSKYPVYITRYIISYCSANSQQGCAGPSENLTVSNTMTGYVIKDLVAGVSYRITVKGVSKFGEGPESQPILMEVVNNDLNTGEIVGVVFAGLFVFVLLVIFITCFCRKMRRLKKDFYMDVDIPVLPPLRELAQRSESQHHYPGRPLPLPPASHPTTGPDDGYSSADTDPACDATRYEPINTKGKTEKIVTSRNVSVSSETALLLSMEENFHSDEHGKCRPYQVTQLGTSHSPCSQISQKSKRYKRAANTSDMCEKENMSVDSYLQVGYSTDSPNHSTGSSISDHQLLQITSPSQRKIHYPETQVGFVHIPPPLSDPPPPPAPPPTGQDIPLHEVSTQPSKNNFSFVGEFELAGSPSASERGLCCGNGSELPSNPGYVIHDQVHSPRATPAPSMTSTPLGGQSLVRPLSEYMKHLPLSYYEEPQPNQDLGPTTEL